MISPTFSTLFVFASLALLVAIPATLILALLGLKQSIRHGRFWRYGLPACMAFVLLQLMLFFNSHAIDSAWSDAERWYYTRHLRSATVYDNMHFPARSTVVLSPRYSHEVIGGAVPVDTPLLGLTVQGDFSIRTTGEDKPTTYLSEGVLAQPASIRGVPCAAGAFTHSIEPESWKDEVNCTLASNYAIRNLELPAGTNAIITFDTVRPPDVHVIGYALHDWSWLGVRCAKGGFRYYGDLTCTLAVTQSVAGYPLAVGQAAVV